MGLFDFLYPKVCVGCKKSGLYWCSDCQKAATVHFPQVCPVCEKPAIGGLTHPKCRKRNTPDGLTAIWKYEKDIKKLIIKLKYKFISDLAEEIVHAAVSELSATNLAKQKWILVPIPLHWKRENWRGFNQSEEIGKQIAKNMNWNYQNLLIKNKPTPQQVGLKGQERKTNIEGVFYAVPSSLQSHSQSASTSNVILFDDVWTTGSTLKEATKVLKRAGIKNVHCLTLAR
jgi:ComF family protein